MPALALTDRDGLYGAVKHAVACKEAGIDPILGADMALVDDADIPRAGAGASRAGAGAPWPGGGASRGGAGAPWPGAGARAGDVVGEGPAVAAAMRGPARLRTDDAPRITLLAVGARGWASLCRLVSAAHQAGERGAPVVTPNLIADHAESLVVLLGPDSDVGRAIAARRPDLAAAALAHWRERAEPVIEVVDHLGAGETFRAARMARLAHESGIPAVLTNAVRYLDPADAPVAQVLDSARRMMPLARQRRADLAGRGHLASGEEMGHVAARIGVSPDRMLASTAELARRCALDPRLDMGIGGRFMPETVGDSFALVRARCEEGLNRRFPRARSRARRMDARHRLDHELAIIAKTGLASYFLTVADVAESIRGEGIRCSIRGSGAGCLVNYLLGISGIDPLEHDLIMERFLSERRRNLPDIDLDVESARRLDAYRVIFGTYGEERVACVSMMETYRARSAIRDVGTAVGLAPHEVDAVAKSFPHIRAAHIRGALAELPELRTSGLAGPQLAEVFSLAERLDGLPRHVAMHPCGVVLSDARLLDRTPVETSIDGFPLSQFDKDDVETAGMIKLDVLGVRMQSAIAYTLAEIERATGDRVDIDAIDHHDEPTFEMIRSARTLGCFQIESPGQRELVGKLLPRDIGDLIVDISLFRPGPVNSDMVTPYLEIRHGLRQASVPHADLIAALRETGGVVIFHEQVLRVIDTMTGCGLSEAELVRRQLSEESAREEVAEWFTRTASARGYDRAVVDRVWEVLAAFGAFGFCKAHAAAFAIPTYQSAWLKRHYPAAFYAGVLTHDPGMYPKRVIVGDARLFGVPVLPIDVNASAADWRVEGVGAAEVPAGVTGAPSAGAPEGLAGPAGPTGMTEGLRAGLKEVKGISEAEVERIAAGQPYTSLRDFWERAGTSRPVTERLVLVGAFDSLYPGGSRNAQDAGEVEVVRGAGAARGAEADRRAEAAGGAEEPFLRAGAERTGSGQPGPAQAGRVSRRDLLARVKVLDRSRKSPRAPSARGDRPAHSQHFTHSDPVNHHKSDADMVRTREMTPERAVGHPAEPGPQPGQLSEPDQMQLDLGSSGGDGFADLVPAGGLRELTAPERVEAELEILGIDLSQHVLSFYEELMTELGVVRSRNLRRCHPGQRVLVAGAKVATQTPAIRSGQRIIFVTLDDATGPVDLAFFESVQDRCAARVFGSWLLVVRGRLRKVGNSVSVNGIECWDLAGLADIRAAHGVGAARAAMAAGDVAAAGRVPGSGTGGTQGPQPARIVYANGFTLSPYAEAGAPGGEVKDAPRKLWHASPGSSGGWARSAP